MERVDSLALDPHKWLFQSLEAGCVLLRDRALLRDTFQVMPEYLRDTESGLEEVNFGNHGIQLTRSFRALKLWLSLQVFGLAAFRTAIARGIALAEIAEAELRRDPAWELVTPADLAVVTFRFVPAGMAPEEVEKLQGRMVEAMIEDGYALATSTMLKGRAALRLCTINPRTSDEEMVETLRRLAAIGRRLSGGQPF
jgi:glutamate/tyrosine decarboxylase-like PLP-dependent enzyme